MRACVVILLFTVLATSASAQSGLSGYVLNLPVYQRYADDQFILSGIPKSQFTDLTRLRLRAPIPIGLTTYLQVEIEGTMEYASERQHALGAGASAQRQLVNLTTASGAQKTFKGTALIDRLYLRFDLMGIDVIAGRQRISWGVGRIWNPTDLFNPLNPAVLGKIEKDGADAILARVTFGDFSDVSFVVNGGRDPRQVNAGFRLRTLFHNVALSAMSGVFDERLVAGGDVTLDVLDAGVRIEGLIGFARKGTRPSDQFVSIVAGVDNQFTSRLYGMIEYFYNGRGETDRIRYSLLNLLNGEVTNVGRHILAAQASYLIHPLATASLTIFRNLNDESMLVSPQILYLLTDNISLSLGGQYFTGGTFSEYWWYPSTVFGRVDLFF